MFVFSHDIFNVIYSIHPVLPSFNTNFLNTCCFPGVVLDVGIHREEPDLLTLYYNVRDRLKGRNVLQRQVNENTMKGWRVGMLPGFEGSLAEWKAKEWVVGLRVGGAYPTHE